MFQIGPGWAISIIRYMWIVKDNQKDVGKVLYTLAVFMMLFYIYKAIYSIPYSDDLYECRFIATCSNIFAEKILMFL